MFANTQMGGMDLAFPDVCLTPPAMTPLPYPNMAAGPMGAPAAYKILFSAAPSHNMGTSVTQTNGDNAGLGTGLVSHIVMGPSRHLTASFTVLLCGMPATRLTSASIQNGMNAPGVRIAPSQVKVVLLAP